MFRGNFCDRSVATQTLTITDPGGGNTAFSISSNTTGLNVSPSSGVTPATVKVTVDPNAFANQKGTVVASLSIKSSQAINIPTSVRVLINSREPAQRGTFVDVPGTLVDVLSDPGRTASMSFARTATKCEVFDGTNNLKIATLRTGNTPKGMAITFDRRYLLVGCDNSHYVNVFDLETLEALPPVRMFNGDYVQSLASSSNAILAVTRNASGGDPTIHRIDLATRTSTRLPSLGVYENKVALNSVLTSSSNGSSILMASADGNVMLYDANTNSFTVSRKDFTALSGAYAASNFNQYVVGTHLLDSSLVPVRRLGVRHGILFRICIPRSGRVPLHRSGGRRRRPEHGPGHHPAARSDQCVERREPRHADDRSSATRNHRSVVYQDPGSALQPQRHCQSVGFRLHGPALQLRRSRGAAAHQFHRERGRPDRRASRRAD